MPTPEVYLIACAACFFAGLILSIFILIKLTKLATIQRNLSTIQDDLTGTKVAAGTIEQSVRCLPEIQLRVGRDAAHIEETVRLLKGNRGLEQISKALEDLKDLKSIANALEHDHKAMLSLTADIKKFAANLEKTAGEIKKYSEVSTKETRGAASLVTSISRSWLHTPYPKRLKLAEQNPNHWRWAAEGLGFIFASPFTVHLLCDREELKKDYMCETARFTYRLAPFGLNLDKKALAFYVRTGLTVARIAVGDHLAGAHTLHALLLHHGSPTVQEAADKLEAEIMHYFNESARAFIAHLSAEQATEKLYHFWEKHLSAKDITIVAQAMDDARAKLRQDLSEGKFSIVEGGSNLHLHIGELVEREDTENADEHPPLGGLARVLVVDGHSAHFEWLCNECRKHVVASYAA